MTFDPTPFSDEAGGASSGITGTVSKYLEALETFWIQYFVAYDDQGQRSLARSVRSGFIDYQNTIASFSAQLEITLKEWWAEVRGDKGLRASGAAVGYAIAYLAAAALGVLLVVWLYRKLRSLSWAAGSGVDFLARQIMRRSISTTVCSGYWRARGMTRESYQTPLEFAFSTGIPETVGITEKYNRVRFGEKSLTADEREVIENWLERLVVGSHR